MSYRLHYAPDNASLIVRMVLLEMQQPFKTVLVDRSRREQDSAAYRALNPSGLIPVLETPQGPLFETGAILLWLTEQHGVLGADEAQRGPFLKWLFMLSNTLHAEMRMLFYPEVYVGPDSFAQTALHDRLQTSIPAHLQKLEAIAPGAPYLLGDRLTVLDFYLCALLRWLALYPKSLAGWFDLSATPRLARIAATLQQLDSVQTAQQAEGLGPAPFTAPTYATPPEGSAT